MIELSADEMSAWRSHPTTGKFLQFLKDYRVQLAEEIATTIASGNTVDQLHMEKVVLICGIHLDLENLQFADIANFYSTPEKEGKEDEPENNRSRQA